MQKLYLHIGTEKTGTTSIQRFLNDNRDILHNEGYHILKCAGKLNHRAMSAYCMDDNHFDDFFLNQQINTLDKKASFKHTFLEQFNEELRSLSSNIHSVIISSEQLHSRLTTNEDLERLKSLLDGKFSQITIICYLREQSQLASSLYSTAIKYGLNKNFDSFLENCTPQNKYFNYWQLLKRWSEVFGRETIKARLFSRSELTNNNLLDDFCTSINENLLAVTNRDAPIENESLSNTGQLIARAVNSLSPRYDEHGFLNSERKNALNIVYSSFSGRENNISPEQYRHIYQNFKASNDKVAAQYFDNRDSLFMYKEEAVTGTHFSEAQVSQLAKLISNIKGQWLEDDYYINLLRDAALKLENVDLLLAYNLMKIAQQGRPNGKLINRKIDEYARKMGS